MSARFAFIVLMFVFSRAVFAQPQPVLTVSFDDSFDGAGRDGMVKATLVGKPELVPGKTGKALKAGPAFGRVEFSARLLNPSGGTVEMWVRPLDWEPNDGKFHVFFDTRDEGALYLYKYFNTPRLLMLTCDNVRGPYASSSSPVEKWRPGQWHHIAGTWGRQGVMSYMDGQPAAGHAVPGSLPKSLTKTFSIGDEPWQFPRNTASLIDEVRLYDRPLTTAHIAAHAAGDYDFSIPLSPETAKLDYDFDPQSEKLRAILDSAGADFEETRYRARFGLHRKGAPPHEWTRPVRFSLGQAQAVFSLHDLHTGDYELAAEVLKDRKPRFQIKRLFTVPSMEWKDNSLGLEDKVLPPWTPLRVRRQKSVVSLSCWGREYSFADSFFPVQVKSAGADLLSRPVFLTLRAQGETGKWTDGTLKVASSSPSLTRAQITGAAAVSLGGVQTSFTARITAEYDGLLLFEISCSSPEKLSVDSISLEIPVRTEHALYRHRWAHSWVPLSGNVPPQNGVVDNSAFVPFAWLGDNRRGLFWFCESDEMWPNAKKEDAVQVERRDGEVVLRLNLLSKGQKLPRDWKWIFGLQATPVKPIPEDWRKWRFSPGRNPNVQIVWPRANRKDSLSDFGFPRAADPHEFQKYIERVHARGMKAVPYLCLTYVTDNTPEWKYFRSIWQMGPADPSIPANGWKHDFVQVSPVGKGYADYIVWTTKKFMARYGIDGLYHDQTHPYSSNALKAGVGYERDGRAYRTYPILGYRALYRRIYAMVKSLPRETFTMAHMSGKMTIPILAYEDSYLDGEHFRGKVKDSYMDVTTLDAFRAEYMGRQWGIMPFFLPEFDAEHARQVDPTRGLMALLMLHDINLWPLWCNLDVANSALDALDAFGYVGAEFVPYFDSVPPATTRLKDVYISAYKRDDGKALLIIGNIGKEDRNGAVKVNANRLGLPLSNVVTWPDRSPLTVEGGSISLAVPRLGYRMVLVAE